MGLMHGEALPVSVRTLACISVGAVPAPPLPAQEMDLAAEALAGDQGQGAAPMATDNDENAWPHASRRLSLQPSRVHGGSARVAWLFHLPYSTRVRRRGHC